MSASVLHYQARIPLNGDGLVFTLIDVCEDDPTEIVTGVLDIALANDGQMRDMKFLALLKPSTGDGSQ